jgi:hypothetical protein
LTHRHGQHTAALDLDVHPRPGGVCPHLDVQRRAVGRARPPDRCSSRRSCWPRC